MEAHQGASDAADLPIWWDDPSNLLTRDEWQEVRVELVAKIRQRISEGRPVGRCKTWRYIRGRGRFDEIRVSWGLRWGDPALFEEGPGPRPEGVEVVVYDPSEEDY